MNQPLGYPATPPPAPRKRPAWVVGGVTIVTFVALLYVIELWDALSGHRSTITASGRWRATG